MAWMDRVAPGAAFGTPIRGIAVENGCIFQGGDAWQLYRFLRDG